VAPGSHLTLTSRMPIVIAEAIKFIKYTKGLRGSGSATPAGMGLINLAGL